MDEFTQVYEAYFRDVELYLRAICHDESLAEELTEQVFFKALKALPGFRGDCDIRVWLCAMARNLYLSHLRRIPGMADIDTMQIPDPAKAMEERVADREQAMAIHRVLHTLKEPYKEVFSLRVFGQLSFGDIGSLFGRTANWACVTYHRACQKIQAEMEDEI
ncbi:sigma-70 family RNA polymerase sigma factor [Pseudoflavonifractor sp. MSJ-30]|uniref:RNA polymerase sigma factor n=1 Tax=Pseudoflavonifractor sp. MSJ-30 TaxID=2841525 RepID=UPI001C0F5602|nr:sigma-70 family RNA polymerase sigma factor [Pseudoflavonifractor sp. MSJ-30]MBU5452738.1 sigma-70 family RNA polymerase sigma factor [Pseudoflavonifractor sp. MSJ-30]